MTIGATLAGLETSANQVAGLRTKLNAGKVNPPAAVIELDRLIAPSTQGDTADYLVRVLVLVQVGDFRNALERIWTLIEPSGPVSSSLVTAMLSNRQVGQVTFEGPGLVEYAGTQYGGGILTCEVFD